MPHSAETWFTLAITDSPSLRVLLADIRDHVRRARLCRRLDPQARAYAVIEPESVRLWVNRPALDGLDVFRRIPLQPAEPPPEHERVTSLIEHDAGEPLRSPAASQAPAHATAGASSR